MSPLDRVQRRSKWAEFTLTFTLVIATLIGCAAIALKIKNHPDYGTLAWAFVVGLTVVAVAGVWRYVAFDDLLHITGKIARMHHAAVNARLTGDYALEERMWAQIAELTGKPYGDAHPG